MGIMTRRRKTNEWNGPFRPLASPEAGRRFKQRHPDWDQLAPNRFASRFFLMENSEVYRAVHGMDLATESLDFDPLASRLRRNDAVSARERSPRCCTHNLTPFRFRAPFDAMSLSDRIRHEMKAVGVVTLFFGLWIGALITLKTLILEEYHISFTGWSKVLLGALVLGKVVLVLEHVPLGAWVQARPAWVGVLLRTLLYTAGVALVLVLEHALRRPSASLAAEREVPHVLVNTLCLAGALLAFNVLSVIQRRLAPGGLLRLFLKPALPAVPSEHSGY